MTARVSIGVATAAVLLAACGSSPTSTGGSPSPSATVTPTPAANTLIVIADYPQSSPETTPIVLHLVRPDGTEATRLTLNAGAITTSASGSRIFVVERGGALKALHRDGSVEELGNLASTTPTPIVASPDGNSWLWGTLDTNGKGTVYAGTKGASPRVVDQSTETARAVRPYSWTQRGPAIEHGAVGIGGYILFYTATGPIDLVDPASASITSLNGTTDCSFSDLATNGMNACFPHGKGHTLSLMAAGGQVTSVALPADRFAVEGAAYFSPNGDQVIVGGATGAGAGNERFATDLVKTSDGSITPLSLDNVRPANGEWAWMPDGSLIVYRPQVAAAGPGVWLVGPSGTITKLATTGEPIGVLTG